MKYILLLLSILLIIIGFKVNFEQSSVGFSRIGFIFGSLGPGIILSIITWRLFEKKSQKKIKYGSHK